MLDYRSVVDSLSHYLQGFSTIPGGFSRRMSEPFTRFFSTLLEKGEIINSKNCHFFLHPPKNWKTGKPLALKMAIFGIYVKFLGCKGRFFESFPLFALRNRGNNFQHSLFWVVFP